MPIQTVGLGAVLRFSAGAALAGMQKAQNAFKGMQNAAKAVGGGVGQIATGIGAAGVAALPLTAALLTGGQAAASFEHQMSAVQAVNLATKEEMRDLTAEAKRLGTAGIGFTATEAAQGMELLARAGFKNNEVLASTGPLMAAAAAEGIDLATTADIVASTMRGMGLEATNATTGLSNAAMIADVLALASARTNSSIVDLGEGLKYATTTARSLGIPTQDLVAALGSLADAGMKGSLGGTGLSQAFARLASPTKQAAALMEKYHVGIMKGADGNVDLGATFLNLGQRLATVQDKTKRLQILTDIFGTRGKNAANILAEAALKTKDGLGDLIGQLQNATGSAEEMARIRMDNLIGQLKNLSAAADQLAIETLEPILAAITPLIKSAGKAIADVAFAMQVWRGASSGGKEINETIQFIALGIIQGTNVIKRAIGSVVEFFKPIVARFQKEGSTFATTFARLATIFVFGAAIIGPVIVALGGLAFIIGTVVVPIVSGLISIFMGLVGILTGPVGISLGVIALAVLALKRNNESFLGAAIRLWGEFKAFVLDVWTGAILPFAEGFMQAFGPALSALKSVWMTVWTEIKQIFIDVISVFRTGTQGAAIDWIDIGRTVGAVVAAMAIAIGEFTRWGINQFRRVFGVIRTLITGVRLIFTGQFLDGILKVGKAIVDAVLIPLRTIVATVIKLADSIPGGGKLVPEFLREFAEKGISIPVIRNRDPDVYGPAEAEAARQGAAGQPNVAVNVAAPKPSKVEITNKLTLDGKELVLAHGKAQKELQDRSGFRATPWERRSLAEHGMVPLMTAR